MVKQNGILKTKQRNVRVFEIVCDDTVSVEKYIAKNKALLDGLLVVLKGAKASECSDICASEGICYAVMGECEAEPQAGRKSSKAQDEPKDLFSVEQTSTGNSEKVQIQERVVEKIVEKVVIQTVYVEKEPSDSNDANKVVDVPRVIKSTTVRSGEDIQTSGDVSVFGRVNSGAKIKTDGCVEIFDTIDGLVECGGEYMIIRKIGNGTVVFNGSTLEPLAFDGKLKRVFMNNGKLEIKDL